MSETIPESTLAFLRAIATISACSRISKYSWVTASAMASRTLGNTERGAVDAGCLALDLGAAGAAIKQGLGKGQADIGGIEGIVLIAETATAGAVKLAATCGGFKIKGRKVEATGLPELELDRLAVLDRRQNLRI